MKEKMSLCNLVSICQKDRQIAFSNSNIGWAKKNGLDILVKYLILLFNSLGGKKNIENSYIFVNEVKNSNMSNNLRQTERQFNLNGESVYYLCFYKLDSKNHIKLGIYTTLLQIVKVLLSSINAFFRALMIGHSSEKYIISRTIGLFRDYLLEISDDSMRFILMTDYNLFSSIIAIDETEKSTVIQHGLLMDDLLCYPIRASHYFAWGISTKQLMKNDPKILITGTYKYSEIIKSSFKSSISTILFCIGSLDYQEVKPKIESVVQMSKIKGYNCIIKCHPGSLYNSEYWKNLYCNENVKIFKETLLQEIDFDLAITESSTAIMDFIFLGKPFILYDSIESYFGRYDKVLPRCENFEDLCKIMNQLDKIDFNEINDYLINNELNSGICTIYEAQRQMDMKL